MAIPALASYSMPSIEDFPTNKVNWEFDPSKAVLLIHDMQDYFLRFYGDNNPLVKQLIDNIVAIRAFCKSQNIPVIYTAQPKDQSPEDRALLNDMWGAGLNDRPEERKVVAALTPDEDDTVLVKWRYSAFHRSDLESMMKEQGKNQLIICGIYGHIGCMVTAVDAFMRDIKPFFVGDAVADFSLEEHKFALKYIATRCGKLVDTASLLASTTTKSTLTKASIKAKILGFIDETEEDFDEDENLIDYGLDSIQIMSMMSEWRKAGVELTFADLAKKPSLNQWWQMIETRLQKSSQPAFNEFLEKGQEKSQEKSLEVSK